MKTLIAVLALCVAMPAFAQQATTAPGGTLRILDKITGRTQDIEFLNGQTRMVGLLAVTMTECRYPSGNRSGDAYTLLTVVYNNSADPEHNEREDGESICSFIKLPQQTTQIASVTYIYILLHIYIYMCICIYIYT